MNREDETPVPVETIPEIINCPKCGMKGILDEENTNWFCCVDVKCPIARFLRYFEYEDE